MLDVNCAWSPNEVGEIVQQLVECRLHWLEEPVWPPENFRALSELREAYGVPVASGENVCTAWQFQSMFDFDAVDYAQPSVTKVGGVSEFLKVVAIAETCNVAIAPHSPYFGPGFLATAQLISAMPGEVPFERFYMDLEGSLYGSAIDPVAGYLDVPQGPGLGLEPDPDVIRDFQIQD